MPRVRLHAGVPRCVAGTALREEDSPGVMGITAWYFLRPRTGELRPLPRTRFESFIFGRGRLPADDEGFVRYAQVFVNLEDRRAVQVLHVDFLQHRALADGTLDHEHLREIMAAGGAATGGLLGLSEEPKGVIRAEHRFARRRLDRLSRWKPTSVELANLRDLVNARAGHEIM